MRIHQSLHRLLFILACVAYAAMIYWGNYLSHQYWFGLASSHADTHVPNLRLLHWQNLFLISTLFLFLGSVVWRTPTILRLIFFWLTLLTYIYGRRLAETYLYADDWYHVLAITRGGWSGLFLPFVDHVTPIWRFIHLLFLNFSDAYEFMTLFPYVGLVNITILSVVFYFCLKHIRVHQPALWVLLLIIYPGYPSIMYWLSTNAVALSAAFGVIALTLQIGPYLTESLVAPPSALSQQTRQLWVFLLCCCSWLTWTTGLAFAFCAISISAMLSWERPADLFNKLQIKKVFMESAGAWSTLVVFALVRFSIFVYYTPYEVSRLLWVGYSLKHRPFDPNIWRAFTWPFFAIYDGMIMIGGFWQSTDYTNFTWLMGRGIGFFLVVLIIAWLIRKQKKGRILLLAYGFAFISFAIVFVGRGIKGITHYAPHGYFHLALSNDWYRISAWTGMTFLIAALAAHFNSPRAKLIQTALLCILIGIFSWVHFQRIENRRVEMYPYYKMSHMYDAAQCFENINWSQGDFVFAARHLYAPLLGTNLMEFWLEFEPSWFDLWIRDRSELWQPANVTFDLQRATTLNNALHQHCKSLPYAAMQKNAMHYAIFPAREVTVTPLTISANGNRGVIHLPSGNKWHCGFGNFQYLRIEFKSNKNIGAHFAMHLNDYQFEQIFSEPLLANYTAVTFDLRALPPEQRCRPDINIEFADPDWQLTGAALVPSALDEDYYRQLK